MRLSILLLFLGISIKGISGIFPALNSQNHYVCFPANDDFFYSVMSDGTEKHIFKWNWENHKIVDHYSFPNTVSSFIKCSESGRYLIIKDETNQQSVTRVFDTENKELLSTNSKHAVLLLFNEETMEAVFGEANSDGFASYNLTVYSLPDLVSKKVLATRFSNYSKDCSGDNPYSEKCIYRDRSDEKYYVYRSKTADVVPLKDYFKVPKRMGSSMMVRSMFYEYNKGSMVYAMNGKTGEKIKGFGFTEIDFGNGFYGGCTGGRMWVYDGNKSSYLTQFKTNIRENLGQFFLSKNSIYTSANFPKREGGKSIVYQYNLEGKRLDSIQLNPPTEQISNLLSEELQKEYKMSTDLVEENTNVTSNENVVFSGNFDDPALIKDPVPFPLDHRSHPIYKSAKNYTDNSKWVEAKAYWHEFSKRYPGVADAYYFESEARFFLKEYEKSLPGFEQAHQIDPMNNRYMLNYLNCMASFQYSDRAAEFGVKMASISDQGLAESIRAQFDQLISNNGESSPYSKPLIIAKNSFNNHFSTINTNDGLYKALSNSYATVGSDSWEGIWTNFTNIRIKLKNRGAEAAVYQFLLQDYYNHIDGKKGGNWIQNKIAQEYVKEYEKGDFSNLYHRVNVGHQMAEYYFQQADYEKADILLGKLIYELTNEGLFRYKLLELYQFKARVLYELDRNVEFANVAQQLEQLNTEFKNPGFNARTLEMLALLYKDSDFKKSESYALEALRIAEKNEMSRVATLKSLISIIYFDNGNTQKGLEYAGVNDDVTKMDEIALFNIGSMLEDQGNLEQAEKFYLQAIEKADKALEGKSDREKLTKRSRYEPIYSGLASIYNKQNLADKAFDIVENSKVQALSSELNANPVSAKEIQNMLTGDEAFVSYKILDPSNFLITIITKDQILCDARSLTYLVNPLKNNFADAFYALDKKLSEANYAQPNFIKPAKENKNEGKVLNEGDFTLAVEFYRAYLTQELAEFLPNFSQEGIDNVGKIMQQEFYGTFVWPFEQAVGQKKKYYLSLDGALHFIPFESFKDGNGTFLGETRQFNVVSSAGILQLIKNRNYDTNKKSVLAFGGAIYEEAEANVQRVSSLSELREWQLKAYDLTSQGKSLTDLFYAMGYGKMNYLEGTLREVKDIGLIQTDAMIITGDKMTESKVKSMSANGELKNYKTIHFATHGWAINDLPTASGIAMCIPKTSSDGEDGRLIANEIAALNLEADMVMLSACQTGLGKLYGGEGVSGLNQALFKAGANATIVSLWPVNDYATSILVKELYTLAKSNGGDYAAALLQVKRNFIKGQYNTETMDLSHPMYWAAFVYNGK
ncbi:MAG: CHAT domain-containing protein [Flavobacteriales bacterium]|nr:CHAT domain-containing protein [Flavobacteriales bacterium]